MHFQHPIQVVQQLSGVRRKFLAAAAGPRLYTFDTETGAQSSVWPSTAVVSPHTTSEQSPSSAIGRKTEIDVAPPEKKRRLSPENVKDTIGETQPPQYPWSTIPILVASSTGEHVVAVTAEDKCIRVLEISIDGSLSQLSERCDALEFRNVNFSLMYTIDVCQNDHVQLL